MEKKFTRAMLCEEFGSKCRECPLHSGNNFKSLPCWLLDESDVQAIMVFNDIGIRLTAVEKKVTNDTKFTFEPERIIVGDCSFDVVDKKLYDKLEAKHEADSRLISEYDLEIKELKDQNTAQNDIVCDLYSNLCTEQKERIRCEAVIKDLKSDVERWVRRYENLRDMDKSKLFDFKNAEEERDHYKGLYSSKCDDYDNLLANQIKTEKEAGLNYKELFHSLNHKHQNVVGEMKNWKERAIEAEKKLKETEEKYNDACVLNKMREDVFEANIKLQKTIEAKDREIGLLRAELDKYKTDDECDDRWID